MKLVYEQPAKLNRYVDDSIPLTWSYRWRSLKRLIPAVTLLYVMITESLLVRAWLANRLTPDRWAYALLAPISIIPLLFLVSEGAIRINHRVKRVLKLKDRWVMLSPSRISRVRWKDVRGWRLEPIQNEPELTRLTLLLGPAKPGGWRRCWPMVLASPQQKDDLVGRLESLRDTQEHNYEVRVSTRVSPPPKSGVPPGRFVLGMSVYLLGIFLFLHTVPPLAFGLSGFKEPPLASQATESPAAQPKARLRAWLATQFPNTADLRRFLLVTGSVLAAGSAASLVGGSLLMNRSIRRTWVAREAEVLSPE